MDGCLDVSLCVSLHKIEEVMLLLPHHEVHLFNSSSTQISKEPIMGQEQNPFKHVHTVRRTQRIRIDVKGTSLSIS